MSKTAVIILVPGFEEIEAITVIDILRRLEVNISTVSLENMAVTGSHHITIQTDKLLSDIFDIPDALIFPGGLPGSSTLSVSVPVINFAKKVFSANKILAAICAAPAYTLASWGLASGKRITTYPGTEHLVPQDVQLVSSPVVIDGNIVTSNGASSSFLFSFALGELLVGKPKVEELKKSMLFNFNYS